MNRYLLQEVIEYAKLTNRMNESFMDVYNDYVDNQRYYDEIYQAMLEYEDEIRQ